MKDKNHSFFMVKALQQASHAFRNGEVPVGAVIVDVDGVVIGRGYNKVERHGCQNSHAEVLAIKQATKKRGWRLDGCSVYVTLEPCLMCFGLIQQSRCAALYFGAFSPLFGYQRYQSILLGAQRSVVQSVYTREIKIEGGLKERESVDILKAFFTQARYDRRKLNETAERFSKASRREVAEEERGNDNTAVESVGR